MRAVILAAGMGRRLGREMPKALIRLEDGKTILQHLLDGLGRVVRHDDITVVVGFQKQRIMQAFPDLTYVENPDYRTTSTAKSLQLALAGLDGQSVLLAEGDVVCDPRVITRVAAGTGERMATHRIAVGEEEMKYRTRPDGMIERLSKVLADGEGEALAINRFGPEMNRRLLDHLQRCQPMDFFESAIEHCIGEGFSIYPVDVSDLYGFDVDFPEDLEAANRALREQSNRGNDYV
jgi:choline kinase